MLIWSGLVPDEGPSQGGLHGPYRQSERLHIYRDNISTLLKNRSAYHCFCTPQRLTLLKKNALKSGESPRYDNKCRHLSEDEVQSNLNKKLPSVIRFKMDPTTEAFHDLVMGKTFYDVGSIEGDPILIKGDGFPTYHFANVVDDHLMEISHVLRGQEWISSTNKHIMLYHAFGWEPPQFAHLPLLLNSDGKKLSKRFGDETHISYFKGNGIFPEALLNFVTFAGSGFEENRQIMNLQEMIEKFSLGRVATHSAVLEMPLLDEVNRAHIVKQMADDTGREELISRMKKEVEKCFHVTPSYEYLLRILETRKEHVHRLADLVHPNMAFLWITPSVSLDRFPLIDVGEDVLQTVISSLEALPGSEPTIETLKENLRDVHSHHPDVSKPVFMKTMRVALSGQKEGPAVVEMMQILGLQESLNRLKKTVTVLSKR